jgi:hypothetical protein
MRRADWVYIGLVGPTLVVAVLIAATSGPRDEFVLDRQCVQQVNELWTAVLKSRPQCTSDPECAQAERQKYSVCRIFKSR